VANGEVAAGEQQEAKNEESMTSGESGKEEK
jgi:hypothetical protein